MSGQLLFADLLREAGLRMDERLARYRPDLTRATGLLPNRQLAPLQLNNNNLFNGILELINGGTNADLSSTGPGVLKQIGPGAPVTVGPIAYPEIDWSSVTTSHGEALLYDSSGPTAEFGPVTVGVTGGGTGIFAYAVGDLIYALASTTLGKLADIAAGNALLSGGVTTAPLWGKIGLTTHVSGIAAGANGGTGVNNGSNLLTVPATGTAALRGVAQAFSESNAFDKFLRAHTTSGTTGYGLRIWDGSNDFGTLQSLDLGGISYLFFGNNRYWDGTGWQQFNTRVGSSFQVAGDKFDFYTFPVSSSVPTSRFGVSAAGDLTHTGFVQSIEITAPAAGAVNTGRTFYRDNGAGKTQFCVIFNTGAIQVMATQP